MKLKKIGGAVVAVAVATVSSSAMAGNGPDLTSLTGAVDVGTVITAVLAIGATLAGLYLAMSGAKKVLSMIRSA